MGCCCTLSQRLMISLFSLFHQKLEWKLDPRHLNLRQGIQVMRAGIINRGLHPQLSLNPRDRRESDSLLYYLVSLFVCFCLKCVVQRKQGWLRNFGLIVKKAFGEVKVGKGSVHEYRRSQDYCPRPFVFFPSLSLFFVLFYYCVYKSKTDLRSLTNIYKAKVTQSLCYPFQKLANKVLQKLLLKFALFCD